jgi:predicted dehydrogenase
MSTTTRRHFLATTAAGAFTLAALPARAAEAGPKKLKLGVIGCGDYGQANLTAAFKAGGVEVPGLCDVDSEHLRVTADKVEAQQGSRPRTYRLIEDLLAGEELDAVIIASPPQWHALHFLAALARGLDVYCEKPLCYDVREGQAMVAAARRSGRMVQIGFQRRQSPCFQAVRSYLESGDAGRVVCAEANIHYTAGIKDTTPQPPPPSLDWDLWCGPAPKLPYTPQIGHVNWRLEQTTGHGHLVDWGIHLVDVTRFILGQGAPRSVSASGGLYALRGKITTPDVLTAHFDFAGAPLTWRHRIWGAAEYTPGVSNGIFFYGEKATVFVTDDRWEVIPRGRNAERQVHEARADLGTLHIAAFLDAVRERKPPACSIEEGLASTVAVKLAMIAYDTSTKVVWDAARGEVVDNPAAASLLVREYRSPWKHPSPPAA